MREQVHLRFEAWGRYLQFPLFHVDNYLQSMDNIEANKGNLATANPDYTRYAEEMKIVSSYLDLADEQEWPQLEPEAMKPEHDEDDKNQEEGLRSEAMELQREGISEMAHVQGADPETGLTAHHDEPTSNHSNHSSSSQNQSLKHNMPKFLAKNVKKLLKTHLKQLSQTLRQQDLNHLYLEFVQKSLKPSLKSLNSFCFTPSQEEEASAMAENFKDFLKKLKKQDVLVEPKEVWSEMVQKCRLFFVSFILSNQRDLMKLAQGRDFNERSKNAGLIDYSERFLQSVKNGTQRGKDVKSKRSTQ